MSSDGATLSEALTGESAAVAAAMLAWCVDAWNRADGVAYGEEYWPDAELVDPYGHIASGRAAIAQEHVGAWAGDMKASRVAGTRAQDPTAGRGVPAGGSGHGARRLPGASSRCLGARR